HVGLRSIALHVNVVANVTPARRHPLDPEEHSRIGLVVHLDFDGFYRHIELGGPEPDHHRKATAETGGNEMPRPRTRRRTPNFFRHVGAHPPRTGLYLTRQAGVETSGDAAGLNPDGGSVPQSRLVSFERG